MLLVPRRIRRSPRRSLLPAASLFPPLLPSPVSQPRPSRLSLSSAALICLCSFRFPIWMNRVRSLYVAGGSVVYTVALDLQFPRAQLQPLGLHRRARSLGSGASCRPHEAPEEAWKGGGRWLSVASQPPAFAVTPTSAVSLAVAPVATFCTRWRADGAADHRRVWLASPASEGNQTRRCSESR
jgi:hypothetical protein